MLLTTRALAIVRETTTKKVLGPVQSFIVFDSVSNSIAFFMPRGAPSCCLNVTCCRSSFYRETVKKPFWQFARSFGHIAICQVIGCVLPGPNSCALARRAKNLAAIWHDRLERMAEEMGGCFRPRRRPTFIPGGSVVSGNRQRLQVRGGQE